MKRNYGKWALWGSLLSWAALIVFVPLSWWAVSVEFADHKPGDPRPNTPMMLTFACLAFLSYPMSFASMVLAAIGVFKGRSVVSAVIGGLVAVLLFGFLSYGLWIVAHGGV
jgi:hypothetical protein